MMWPTPPSSPRHIIAPVIEPFDENHAAESGPRRPVDSLLVVAADGVEAKAEVITQAPPHTSTSAVLCASLDASCCVDVTDSDDELVPYAESYAARREKRARERLTAGKPTVAVVSDRVAHQPHAPALGTVDAPSTLHGHGAYEATGVLTKTDVPYSCSTKPCIVIGYTAHDARFALTACQCPLSLAEEILSNTCTVPTLCLQVPKSSCHSVGVRNSTLRLHKEEARNG